MFAALTGVVVVLGVLVFWWLRGSRPSGRSGRPAPAVTRPQPLAPPRTAHPAESLDAPAPELRFDVSRLVLLDALDAAARQALLAQLRDIQRPPQALHKLLSPEFRARASSTELAELVMTEPVVAARVMGAVNSPLYGLRKPLTSLGQAITFLGLTSVRNLCLQYLMVETMAKHHGVALRAEFDTLGQASMLASELVLQMAKRLQLPDAAALSTQLVLSYLGRFATALLLHKRQADQADGAPGAAVAGAGASLVQRALAEQACLGLASGEIGLLLMQEWGLPESMVGEGRGIARILFAAEPAAARAQAARAALCGLGASLAERTVRGPAPDLSHYEPADDDSDELRALRRNLPQPMLAQIGLELRESAAARKATA